jgi:hypothetical protein
VGVIETHGRSDTAALLDGLDMLPLKRVGYRGKVLAEFDLDGALERRPALILVDELAHSNAPGSRQVSAECRILGYVGNTTYLNGRFDVLRDHAKSFRRIEEETHDKKQRIRTLRKSGLKSASLLLNKT